MFLPSFAALPLIVRVAIVPLTEIVITRFAAVTLTTGFATTAAFVALGAGVGFAAADALGVGVGLAVAATTVIVACAVFD